MNSVRGKTEISEDELWFAARVEVIKELDFGSLYDHFTHEQEAHAKEIIQAVLASAELEAMYSGILECQFEDYRASDGQAK